MKVSQEQIEFIRKRGITRCPPGSSAGSFATFCNPAVKLHGLATGDPDVEAFGGQHGADPDDGRRHYRRHVADAGRE